MMLQLKARDEDGIVMITVLMVCMVLLIIVAGSIAYAIGSQPISRHDQNWNAALSAAEAGLDDYLFRLNENDQYYLYSSSNAPPDGNQAFAHWVDVPNSGAAGQFRYSADTTFLTSQGAILVTSTGRSGNATRTVQATLRRHAFIDYLYFTDYETTDPAAYPTSSNSNSAAWAQTNCAKHYYEGRNSSCTDINFGNNDTINGPLHSNDAILVCGSPTFTGNVTTSWNPSSGNKWRANGSCSNSPSFKPGDPKYASPLTMPPNNVAIKADADKTLGGTGCLYTGPTSITLNSSGTMNVTSPFTKAVGGPNNCATGTNLALPTNGVIYVQNVPSSTTDYNYTAGCITHAQLASGSSNGSPVATVNNPLGYPQYQDITAYSCTAGDAFVSGTLKGRLTIAADNNIDVIGNIAYQGGTGGSDLLGLVANNYIEVYHPVDLQTSSSGTPATAAWCDAGYLNSSGSNYYCNLKLPGGTTALDNPTIDAAILSVSHSFRVQNYAYGDNNPLGSITINGAIAQRYRGIVGLINTSGYTKNYNYDQRLKYQSPPRFLSPVAAAWQIVTWIEQKPAYAYNAP
jgi:Tfp pilus assembly protein PilX